ncbi:DNA-binding protein [Sporosarcina sp. NCCP-2716]|nr:DNA-binding protein [Sporosarcina sp. NCCP-2716]
MNPKYKQLSQETKQNALDEAFAMMTAPDLQDTTDRIRTWAIVRELDAADPFKQMLKLMEEVGEIAAALARGDMAAVKDGIGDVHVVQTILSMQLGTSIEECAGLAYDEIKDRKGKMVDGVFIKEEDLQ